MTEQELEIERKKMELKRVEMARLEMEFKIKERQSEIARLEDYIEIQKKRELELQTELKGE